MMPCFEDAFGSDYGPERPESRWDRPYFDNHDLAPTNRFVAWVDLMGAENHMLLSLPKSAVYIAKIHAAGIDAGKQFSGVSIHPITDGFYAVSERWSEIQDFTSRVMRSLAHCFQSTDDHQHRFLVRAGVAYGRFIDGSQLETGSNSFSGQDAYLHNVMIGSPLAWAYKAESKAPPFGIYIDQSITTHSGERIAWVLHRWWGQVQSAWAKQFGTMVEEHLAWLNKNAIGTRYPTEKHENYVRAVKEYFES